MRFPILSVTPPGILMPGLRCGAEAPSLQPGLQILRPPRGLYTRPPAPGVDKMNQKM
jgi:hypothetical protein